MRLGLAELANRSRALLTLAVALATAPACATLGEACDSIQADQLRFQGHRVQRNVWPAQVYEIQLPDGSRVRQFVSGGGEVFAVTWNSRLKPDLAQLLGRHYKAYAQAMQPGGNLLSARRPSQVAAADLVVGQTGRGSAHAGWAYIPSLTPRGFDVAALR